MSFFKKEGGIGVLIFHILVIGIMRFIHLPFTSDVTPPEDPGYLEDLIVNAHGNIRYFVYDLFSKIIPLYGCLVIFFSGKPRTDLKDVPNKVLIRSRNFTNNLKILPAAQIGYYMYDIYIILQFNPELRLIDGMLLDVFFVCIVTSIALLYTIEQKLKC